MDKQFVDLFLSKNKNRLPSYKMSFLREELLKMEESKEFLLNHIALKNPYVLLIVSILFGILGIDRFILKESGKGFLKLITLGGLGIWALLDIFKIMEKTRVWNYKKTITSLGIRDEEFEKKRSITGIIIGVLLFLLIILIVYVIGINSGRNMRNYNRNTNDYNKTAINQKTDLVGEWFIIMYNYGFKLQILKNKIVYANFEIPYKMKGNEIILDIDNAEIYSEGVNYKQLKELKLSMKYNPKKDEIEVSWLSEDGDRIFGKAIRFDLPIEGYNKDGYLGKWEFEFKQNIRGNNALRLNWLLNIDKDKIKLIDVSQQKDTVFFYTKEIVGNKVILSFDKESKVIYYPAKNILLLMRGEKIKNTYIVFNRN